MEIPLFTNVTKNDNVVPKYISVNRSLIWGGGGGGDLQSS